MNTATETIADQLTNFDPIDWDIANEIARQATVGALMSLGAHNRFAMTESSKRSGGCMWDVRILPMRKDGTRGAKARIMRLQIELIADTYTITVDYWNRGQVVTHYSAAGVYCDQLERLLLALDYDGDEILNPRILAG